jgi:uncharacterized membrane protein
LLPGKQTPSIWKRRPRKFCRQLSGTIVAFLFLKQYQRRTFVRYHAFQSVFFWGAALALVLLGLLASMFGSVFLWLLVGTLIGLLLFFTWLLLSIKALQGERFELPWLGALAEQQLGR